MGSPRPEAKRELIKCWLCETVMDAMTTLELSTVTEPFCWKCGTYINQEGNRWGLKPEGALAMAKDFDARIEATLKRIVGKK